MRMKPWKLLTAVAPFLLAATQCTLFQANGRLQLSLADAPVDDATRIVVQVRSVELQRNGGNLREFDFSPPQQIDLLALPAGQAAVLLNEVTLRADDYEFVRLKVDAGRNATDSFIELKDGSRHALFLSDADASLLKVTEPFTVTANKTLALTLDLDLRKSVREPETSGGPFVLKPALRLVEDEMAGAIAGAVGAARAGGAGCSQSNLPAVYVYQTSNVTPDDVGSPTEPLASAIAQLNSATGDFDYTVGFLEAGGYTVAFTCEAGSDDPSKDDDIAFSKPVNAVVEAGKTTTVDFR